CILTTKIGRNDPCPCGSGKKYKRCCIGNKNPRPRPGIAAPDEAPQRMHEILSLRNAEENVRRQQQRHGNPIISFVDHGYRLVAVRNTIHWSKAWIVFPDFLLDFMKKTLGRDWGAREKSKGLHPVFRWLEKFQHYSASRPTGGKLKTGDMMGFIACWLHLAYALYLIAHNDQLPKPLLKRLR